MTIRSTDTTFALLRAVVFPLAALVALLTMSAVAGVFWIAEYQTDLAIRQQARLAEGGLHVHAEKLGSSAKDYGYWDDAVAAIIDKPDLEWVKSNIGDGAEKSLGAAMAFVINPDGQSTYSRIQGVDSSVNPEDVFAHGFHEAHDAWKKMEPGSVYSGTIGYRQGAALITIAPVRSWTDAKRPITGHALVLVRLVDDDLLKTMARDYELAKLVLARTQSSIMDMRASVTINDEDGHSVARLAWQPSRPGDKLLEIALPFLAVFLVALTVLATVVFRHAMASARIINDSNARANSDPLTGLSNRRFLMEELQRHIDRIEPEQTEVALFYVDLDGFKGVNDTLGHLAGDELLQQVATRLQQCSGDMAKVARLGGDEFAIFVNHRKTPNVLELIARSVLRELHVPFALSAGTARISASIGIACASDRTHTLEALFERADAALYKAKAAGKNRYALEGRTELRSDRAAA